MPLHPIGPVIVILTALGLVGAALTDPVSGRPGVFVSLGVMTVGALYYRLVVRRSDAWAHHDPDEEELVISAELATPVVEV